MLDADEKIRADIALKQELILFFIDKEVAETVYCNRYEVFVLLKDWLTRIEQEPTGVEISNNE